MRRIYFETIKKWLVASGISIGTLVGGLFLYLSFLGVIEITGHSGDMICDGTELDPCYAYINLTAKEDIFIYPVGYDPWGRNTIMEFSPGVKSWKLQRSWGSGWRNIPLNETCTGTWCGAPDNLGVAYSYVLREGRDYQFRIVALKDSPTDVIKWAVNYDDREYLDPTWYSRTTDTRNLPRSHYTGDYRILSQTGAEEVYEVSMKKVGIDLDNETSIQGTQICINAEWDDNTYPTNIPLYINYITNATYYDFEVEEDIEEDKIKYKLEFCYIANPLEDYYLKFGENSLEIIQISSAEHLDSNRDFISDIFNETVNLDNIWSEEIPDGDFVRVTFEENLTSDLHIKIYPNITGNPYIKVYEFNSSTEIARFTNITSFEYNTVQLDNLTGNQDTFDLEILNGTVSFDHIVDPPSEPGWTGGLGATATVNVGENITYTGTANENSDGSLDWILVVCSTDSITDQPSVASCDGEELCRSEGIGEWDVETSCNYLTTVDDVNDTFTGYGFLCGSDDRCTNGETVSNTTDVNFAYGNLEVSISKPDDDSDWNEGDTNLTINATVTCVGGECGTVSALARYNLSASVDTAINVSNDEPFYIINSSGEMPDLISYYKLNDDAANTNVDDEINAYEGTLIGGETTAGVSVAGKIGTAFELDGDDYISLDGSVIDGLTDWSVSMWFKTNSQTQQTLFFVVGEGSNTIETRIEGQAADNLFTYVRDTEGDSVAVTGSDDVVDDAWHHVIVVKEGTTVTQYVDNGIDGTDTNASLGAVALTSNMTLGARPTILRIVGQIDEYGFWNRALTSDERDALWNGGNGLVYPLKILSNPQTQYLSSGESWDISWILNVTSNLTESFLLDVLFNSTTYPDNITANNTADRLVNLNSVPAADTCSPNSPLTSSYEFDCSDDCTQSTNLDAGGYNISLVNSGIFNLQANITNFDKIFKDVGCQINIYSSGGLSQ